MEALPTELTIDILSRLPVNTIMHCKRVCKKWRDLVSDSSFVNLHLSRSPTTGIIILDNIYRIYNQRILKWVEIDDKVDHHRLNYDALSSLDLKPAPIFQPTRMVGSVNGLICLWHYSPKVTDTYICNPVTREYVILPTEHSLTHVFLGTIYGFGASSLTGEYKVVRAFQTRPRVLEAEVYTLGTGQWRNLGRLPYWHDHVSSQCYGPFLNDHCHWIVYEYENGPEKICAFDLNKETFRLFPSSPPQAFVRRRGWSHSLGILKGCLCKLDTYGSELTIWVMKEYGINNSWHKQVVIRREMSIDLEWPSIEPMHLIECLKDGSILMSFEKKLCVFDPRSETMEVTEVLHHHFSGLAYRPSFLKLENFESERERVQMF